MPSVSIPLIAAGVMGAGAIGSSLIGADASKSAANTQAAAANQSANTQLGIFNQTQSNLAPYNQVGQSALQQLASLFGLGPGGGGPTAATAAGATSALTQYPGYQFGLSQGQSALDRSAASRGLLLSGAQLKDSQQFGQQYGMQQGWQPYLAQLSGLASLGENAGASVGNIGANTGANVGNAQLAAGQANASGIVGQANAITGGVQSGLNNALLGYTLNQGQGGQGGGTPGYFGGSPDSNLNLQPYGTA